MRRGGLKSANIVRISDFTGGEASIFPLTRMPAKYSTLLQNCYIAENGKITSVPGYQKVNTNSCGMQLTSGFEFRKSDGSIIILAAGGGNIYKVDGAALTVIKNGLAAAKVSFASINDTCIMSNGVDAPMKYDGVNVTGLGGTPPATAFKAHVYKGRVWMIEKTHKLLATYSALDAPEDYTSANNAGYIDFNFVLREGDELLDIVTYIDLLVFFFRNHIAIYSGSNPTSTGDFQLVQLIEGSGVHANDTVQLLGTDMGFLYDSGVKSLRQVVTTGNLNADDVSVKINPTLLPVISQSAVWSSAHYQTLGWYMLLIDTVIFCYSYGLKTWHRITGADVQGMFSTVDGKVYFCGNGFLYQFGIGTKFDTVNPDMVWQSAWLPLSQFGLRNYPKLMELNLGPEDSMTIDVQLAYDLRASTAEQIVSLAVGPLGLVAIDDVTDWDALDPLDAIPFGDVRVPIFGGGRLMQITIRNSSGLSLDINDIVLIYLKGGLS